MKYSRLFKRDKTELEIKQTKELYCPKCGGELTLEESKAIGMCQHCESAFLLTDEEIFSS